MMREKDGLRPPVLSSFRTQLNITDHDDGECVKKYHRGGVIVNGVIVNGMIVNGFVHSSTHVLLCTSTNVLSINTYDS